MNPGFGSGPVVLFNGATGGLGRHMPGALRSAGLTGLALAARLEDGSGVATELAALPEMEEVVVIHLAARVSVPACEADPQGAQMVNVIHAGKFLDTAIRWAKGRGLRLRVVYVSTGHVYAAAPIGSRLTEDAPTHPRSVYATTKLAAEGEFAARTTAAGVPLTVARVFGLLAPGQPDHYVLPALIGRVREDHLSEIPGLDAARDYLDARDVCRDLLALATSRQDEPSIVVNVCSGEPTTIRELLALVIRASGGDPARAASVTAAAGRADDVAWIVGDPGRLIARTGVQPRSIPMDVTVGDAIDAAVST